jgi:hypothetical protein
MPTWLDLNTYWRVVSRRVTAVSSAGYTIEVVARAQWQPVSRAHVFVFDVPSHEEPLANLRPDSGVVVEAVSVTTTMWSPVKVKT